MVLDEFVFHGGAWYVSPLRGSTEGVSVHEYDVVPEKWVRYTFIQIEKKLIQKHFHPKTLSSKTISSKTEDNFIHDTFIQKRFHPMTLSSKTTFFPNPKH